MVLCGVNLWTGGPVLAVWVGSRVQGSSGGASMTAIAVVAVVLIAVEVALVSALGRLTARYDELTGFRRPRRPATWLKAQSAERDGFGGAARRISPSERVLAVVVVVGVVVFEAWFFLLSGSSLPSA